MPSFLNVGAGDSTVIPPHFSGWKHVRLDIDARYKPDIVLDARELNTLTPCEYDAVYCAHNLEHYHRFDGMKVLNGMRHVCKHDGFVEIHVPDLGAVVSAMAQRNLDIDDILYHSRQRPILVRDVIYGYQPEIERSGQEFFAHKTGFTRASLHRFMQQVNFRYVLVATRGEFELVGIAFCSEPKPKQLDLLKIPSHLFKK